MNLVFHISEDVSEIGLKHCAFSKTNVKAPRICQISAVSDLCSVRSFQCESSFSYSKDGSKKITYSQ